MGLRSRYFAALFLVGCSASAPPARTVAPGPPRPELGYELPAGAVVYGPRVIPAPAAGGGEGESVERALVEAARGRGMALEADARLVELGRFIVSAFESKGKPPGSATIDACARRLGLIEPVPLFMIFGKAEDGSWATSVQGMLANLPRSATYNRQGVAVVSHSGQPLAVAVLSAVSAEIQPIPRRAREGGVVILRGRLRDRHQHPDVEVTRPNGTVTHIGDKPGTDFDFVVPLPTRGVHRVELLAEGPFGVEVLANFPVFAGVDEPKVVTEEALSETEIDPKDARGVESKLLALLNEARIAAGVPALASHNGLAEVAVLHSRDMVESGFFGHDSPTNGDPATRVHKKGLAFVLIAENVGRGSTAREVHNMLLESPGHRANALDPNLTHVGIGVVLDMRHGHPEIVATQEFGGVARPVNLSTAAGEIIRTINAERSKAGVAPLVADPVLVSAARRGAELFFRDPTQSQQQVVASVNESLIKPVNGVAPIGKRMRAAQSFLSPVISIERAPKIDRALDPSARYVGVGVAQGARPETGPSAIAIVVVLGWPR
jgi:uncharacterized protein YkwD